MGLGHTCYREQKLTGGPEDSVQDPGLDLAWEEVGGVLEKANLCLLLKSRARPLSLHPALVPLPTLTPPFCYEVSSTVLQHGVTAPVCGECLNLCKLWTKPRPDPEDIPFLSLSL